MKQCVNCKKIIEDDEVICPNCGKNPDRLQQDNAAQDNNDVFNPINNTANNNVAGADLTNRLAKANNIINSVYEKFMSTYGVIRKAQIEKMSGDAATGQGAIKNIMKIIMGWLTGNSAKVGEALAGYTGKTYRERLKRNFQISSKGLLLLIPVFVLGLFLSIFPDEGFLGFIKKVLGTIAGVAYLVIGLGILFKQNKERFTSGNNYKEYTKQYEENFCNSVIAACSELKANQQYLSFIPNQYWYPTATQYMCNMSQQSRVSNINEALNMCDEYISREKMDPSKKQQLDGYEMFRIIFIDNNSQCNYQYVNDEQYFREQATNVFHRMVGGNQ